MANRLLLPSYIVSHFCRPEPCPKCRRIPGVLRVEYPVVTLTGNDVLLVFRARCTCGGSQPIRVRWPILFFGFVLARLTAIEAPKRARQTTGTMQISSGHCELLGTFARDFQTLMAEEGHAATEPSALDRMSFEIDEAEWPEFLRRMGFEAGPEPTGEIP